MFRCFWTKRKIVDKKCWQLLRNVSFSPLKPLPFHLSILIYFLFSDKNKTIFRSNCAQLQQKKS